MELISDKVFFKKFINTKMPFGKYAGRLLIDLPEPYVVWFKQKGFPPGEIGRMLGLLYEIKLNGLEYLFDPLRETPLTEDQKYPDNAYHQMRKGRKYGC